MGINQIFIILFAVISILHLISLFFKRTIFHDISKSLLMPALLVVYILNAQNVYWPIVAALVFGCAGDVFLLDIKNLLRFRLGLASFLIGHLAYIIAFIDYAQPFNTSVLAISFVIAIIFGICLYKLVHPKRDMKIPVVAYEVVITAMGVLAFQVFINQGTPLGLFIFIGSLCFLLSDSILARFTFVRQPKYGHSIVMITYIAAQFFIVWGFCGL